MKVRKDFLIGILVLSLMGFVSTPVQAGPCEDLKSLNLGNTQITDAQHIVPPYKSETSSFGNTQVDFCEFCRVKAVSKPTEDSEIWFEVWMPLAGKWNGKFNGVGNGALGGGINYPAMKDPLFRGYAVASTDTGHSAPSSDAGYAFKDGKYHAEKVIDWGHRAVHEMTVAAKEMIKAYYGQGPRFSYFTGCSGGGQQALSEAQRYPKDYDGIVSGAPSNFFTHLDAGQIWRAQAVLGKPESYIPSGGPQQPDKLTVIYNASLAKCDALDGLKDGIIQDPRKCDFDPATLLCPGGVDAPNCLTASQVEALKKLYAGPSNPASGEQIFPGFPPGSESGWGRFVGGPAGSPFYMKPNPIADTFFKFMVFENPNWNFMTFDFNKDMAATDNKLIKPDMTLASAINATNPDLSRFRQTGGKLIMYHGWNDPNIPARNTINYHQSVLDKMKELDDFFRLFLVPGMGHCSGGPGTDQFDALPALEQWVEKGVAPQNIPASHVEKGAVTMTRPLCPYPRQAVYNGTGDPNDIGSFKCQ